MPSAAHREVRTLYPEVDQLLKLGRDLTVVRQNACARAAVVLTHAHLERYIERVTREAVDHLNNNAPANTRWLSAIGSTILVDRLIKPAKEVVNADGERKRRGRVVELVKLVRDADRVSRQCPLDARVILSGRKYPKRENVERVFERLGFDNVIIRLCAADGLTYDTWLETLNMNRGAIAHGDAMAPHIVDVRNTVNGVRRLIAALDRVLGTHLQGFTGTVPW